MGQVVPLPTSQTKVYRLWRLYVRARGAYEFDPCPETLEACRQTLKVWRDEFTGPGAA